MFGFIGPKRQGVGQGKPKEPHSASLYPLQILPPLVRMLEILLVILLLVAFFLVAYKGAIHEFQILQKDWAPNIDWSSLLSEQLPLVIRNVDGSWKGGWGKSLAKKPWPIQVRKDNQVFKGKWNEWLASPPGQPPIVEESMWEIAELQRPPVETWEDGGFRRPTWIPAHLLRPSVHVLAEDSVQAVRKTTAAATVIQATDGVPLQVWLAHEGAIPASVSLEGANPWALTQDQVPWIQEVKFIEIKLRPGNALVVPTHWYYALKPTLSAVGDQPTMADGAWYWIAPFHSPVSWGVSQVRA